MRRRNFISLIAGTAAWPLGARAQQPPMPVIGYINASSPAASRNGVAAFQRGLH
jgi:putative tryptophan/tyrosine transport system substrate-binding protein